MGDPSCGHQERAPATGGYGESRHEWDALDKPAASKFPIPTWSRGLVQRAGPLLNCCMVCDPCD